MKLFIKSGCPWCIKAEDYLRAKGFQFEIVNVLADAAAMAEMQQLSGQTLAPTLAVDGKVLADFDVVQLEAFLATHGIRPA